MWSFSIEITDIANNANNYTLQTQNALIINIVTF